MAVQARLIGRLGGGVEVTATPVSASGVSSSGATLHTVEVPAGERWLIVCTGAGGGSSATAELSILDRTQSAASTGAGIPLDIATTITGPATVPIMIRARGYLAIAFTGTVYTVPLP